jgi:eukaryotic-like serine/threonine-protein kinase
LRRTHPFPYAAAAVGGPVGSNVPGQPPPGAPLHPPDDSWGLDPGAVLGDGRTVVARIGGGADHEVFLVDDPRHGRCVAKVARPRLADIGGAGSVVVREALPLIDVADPRIVRCLDVVLRGRHPHLLLEHVPGPTLRAVLRDAGRLTAPAVAALGERIAGALAVVAARGWVHLDVKPENIIARPSPRLLDFNIACRADETSRMTHAIGTPAYMAPEQRALGGPSRLGPVGPAADVYALGVVLHEALTGELPSRQDRALLLRAPEPFGPLLARALAPDPGGRPEAAEIQELLRSGLARAA